MISRGPSLVLGLAAGVLAAIAVCAPASAVPPASGPGGHSDPAPRVTMRTQHDDPTRIVVEANGLEESAVRSAEKSDPSPNRWRAFLVVRVVRDDPAQGDEPPALLGTYRLDRGILRFEPRFPIEPGLRYRAEFDPGGRLDAGGSFRRPDVGGSKSRARMTAEISIGRPSRQPTATVNAVYPTRAVLPENLLRFYVHFSAPMSRGEAYRHIRLLDSAGRPIEDPFLELDEELWSGDGKRFTLLFDPGRIKRGLRPREEVGPVLEAGRSYELVVDPGWHDAHGIPLRSGFRKAFRAAAADERSPDPKTWSIIPPAPETRTPLDIRFPEPLDRALLDRLIAVRDGDDRPVAGTISVAEEETFWRFTPDAPWRVGAHRLVIGTDLEDVAGNSVARPFEVDMVGPISTRIAREAVILPFRIGLTP